MEQPRPQPVLGEVLGAPQWPAPEPSDSSRQQHPPAFQRSGGDQVVADRERIARDDPLGGQLGPARVDRDIERQQLREVGEQWRVVLEDEATDIEGAATGGPVEVVPADLFVLVNDENALRTLFEQHRRRHEPADAGAEHDRVVGRVRGHRGVIDDRRIEVSHGWLLLSTPVGRESGPTTGVRAATIVAKNSALLSHLPFPGHYFSGAHNLPGIPPRPLRPAHPANHVTRLKP